MIIAVDFDGTLHTGEWPEIGVPKAYAVHAMRSLHEAGHYLIIWSCREGSAQTRMVNWLLEHGIPFDRINDHHPACVVRYGGDARKIFADLYLDDKQLGGLPDWVYDMNEARFYNRDCLQRRPGLELQIHKVRGTVFPRLFKPHYYLDLPAPVAAEYFVGFIGGEPVCHVAITPLFTAKAYRATRLVILPEWQGIGVGTKFLNAVCQYHLEGRGRCGHKFPVFFHTSHPQLCGALRHSKRWKQTGASLYGANKSRSAASMQRSVLVKGKSTRAACGYGGHFRAVQAFKYIGGENGC